MRIVQLDLKAFGHFTNRQIIFNSTPDFHIVYGPNEAGKTTISRALHAALFGIDDKTTDDHLHSKQNLRVGVVLTSLTGEQLAVMRMAVMPKKVRKNSLVKYDPSTGEENGETIAEELLAMWLGSLTKELYTSMFGLNHEKLVDGGQALSEGKGEIGHSLFEAGAGLSTIRGLRLSLEKEADSLFRPRASSSEIHKTIERYNTERKKAKESQVKPAEWRSLQQCQTETKAAYDEVRRRQALLQEQAPRLERLAAVLPDVATHAITKDRLTLLGKVTELAEDAPTARMTAKTQLEQAEVNRSDALTDIARLQKDLEGIPQPSQSFLDENGSIEALYHSINPYRTARDEVLRADSKIKEATITINTLLNAIGAEQWDNASRQELPTAIPSATLCARIQSLISSEVKLRVELESASNEVASIQQELSSLSSEIAALPPLVAPASVVEVLEIFDAEGNPEAKATDLAQQIEKQDATLRREAADLSRKARLAEGSVATLVAMGTPLPEEINRFRTEREESIAKNKTLHDKIKTIENDLVPVEGELEGIMQKGKVPTAEQLTMQRHIRDRLWKEFRGKLFPSEQESVGTLPTAAEYEAAVGNADSFADVRFADAARVTQHAELIKRRSQMSKALDLERGRLDAMENELKDSKRRWQGLIDKYGLPPLGVPEMIDWLNQRTIFLQHHQSYLDLKDQEKISIELVEKMRSRFSGALHDAGLPPCGETEPLSRVVARVRPIVTQAGKTATRKEVLSKDKKKYEDRLARATTLHNTTQSKLAEWRLLWGKAMGEIRLAENALAEEATARLREFAELENALNMRDQASVALNVAQATVARTESGVTQICEAVGHDRANKATDVILENLYARLLEEKESLQRRKTLQDKIEEIDKAKIRAEQQMQRAEQELAKLMTEAGCATLKDLIEAERRSAEYRTLARKLIDIEDRLAEASALPLEALLGEVNGQDLVQVRAELSRVKGELTDLAPEIEMRHGELKSAQIALDKIDGEAVAALAEQRSLDEVAHLSNVIGNYVSARLAASILSEVIEEYRQRYQGPLLARASELFATITNGRFVKVAPHYDEDRTILVGVRPNGRREPIDALSTGTRDQLFLALRLAAIESHVVNQAPMPVVVDDIVINFDDASASATFSVLAELSRKTQVLFFTHHEHLIDRAANAIGNKSFAAHQL